MWINSKTQNSIKLTIYQFFIRFRKLLKRNNNYFITTHKVGTHSQRIYFSQIRYPRFKMMFIHLFFVSDYCAINLPKCRQTKYWFDLKSFKICNERSAFFFPIFNSRSFSISVFLKFIQSVLMRTSDQNWKIGQFKKIFFFSFILLNRMYL